MRQTLKNFIYQTLYNKGFNPAYLGFEYLIQCCECLHDIGKGSKPFLITKELYPVIAAANDTTWQTVEKNIRYSIVNAGIDKTNYQFIRELMYLAEFAGY